MIEIKVSRRGIVYYDAKGNFFNVSDYSMKVPDNCDFATFRSWVRSEYERSGCKKWKRRYRFRIFRWIAAL